MEIKVLKTLEYKTVPVWIRHFADVFEYLFIYKNNLYSMHSVITPRPYRKFFKNPYTEKEINAAIQLTLASARVSIDILLEKQK